MTPYCQSVPSHSRNTAVYDCGSISMTSILAWQVMLLKNLDSAHKLVNGSRGEVVGFDVVDLGDRPNVASAPISDGGQLYPRVSFETSPGVHVERVLTPDEWSVESGGNKIAGRIQVPLKLSYALSIHKSQGCNLNLHSNPCGMPPPIKCVGLPGGAYLSRCRACSCQ